MLVVAFVAGNVGGLAFELTQVRRGETGSLERPHPLADGRYWDIGFWASLLVGGIAAAASLYFFSPQITVLTDKTTVAQYDLAKLIELSLIVGSGGAAFLSSMRGRL